MGLAALMRWRLIASLFSTPPGFSERSRTESAAFDVSALGGLEPDSAPIAALTSADVAPARAANETKQEAKVLQDGRAATPKMGGRNPGGW